MASYYVAWHMKEALAPVLFKDDDKEAALAARPGPLAPAVRSPKALKKIAHKRTEERWPAHSFETLLADLGTTCVNTIEPTDRSIPPFTNVTLPTPSPAPGPRAHRRLLPPRVRRVVRRPLPGRPNPQVDDLGFANSEGTSG
jgi:hypothetical protein